VCVLERIMADDEEYTDSFVQGDDAALKQAFLERDLAIVPLIK
jgi:hypothetical protein